MIAIPSFVAEETATYYVVVQVGQVLNVEINGTGGAPVSFLWWENGGAAVDQGKEFSVTPVAAGTYGIIVKGTNGGIVDYTIDVDLAP